MGADPNQSPMGSGTQSVASQSATKSGPVTFTLDGFKELFDDLQKVPEKAKQILRASLRDGCKVIASAAKQLVPIAIESDLSEYSKKKGYKPGDLKRSITVRATPGRRRGTIAMSVVTGGTSGMFSGRTWYGGVTEYGSRYQKPQRWLQSAFDDNHEVVLEAIKGKLGEEIGKALKK